MVDQALEQIEEPPAGEHQADQPAPLKERRGSAAGPPQQPKADTYGHPREGVEQAVGKGVCLKPGDGVGRVAALAGEKVVPLEDLM